MKKILTRTFFRFAIAFALILVISFAVMLVTSSVVGKSSAAALEGMFGK